MDFSVLKSTTNLSRKDDAMNLKTEFRGDAYD